MRPKKITLIAIGAAVLLGTAGFSTLVSADPRGDRGHGMRGDRHGHHHYGRGKHQGKHHGRGHRLKRLLERFDTDKDGKLTQVELDAARRDLLTKHDANGDGKLALVEFENLWVEVKRRRIVRGFQRLDTDGDATVTLAEFLEPYADKVERMDRNGDGTLSREDRRRGMRGGQGPRSDGKREKCPPPPRDGERKSPRPECR